jgi:hypothetical protein
VSQDAQGPLAANATDSRRLLAGLAAVLGPSALVTAVAVNFGLRREQSFVRYFGIDPSVLDFSTSDYVTRSVDALFAPMATVLLLLFATVCARVLLAGRTPHVALGPGLAVLGLAGIAAGVALAAGGEISSRYVYLQALAPGVGALLVSIALELGRPVDAQPVAVLRFVALIAALVSLFWATSEYAANRGQVVAGKLAADLTVNPQVTIFSTDPLGIATEYPGTDRGAGACVGVSKTAGPGFRYAYTGFTLLLRNNGRYFVTPTPTDGKWDASRFPVLIIAEDPSIRIELRRGEGYSRRAHETAFSGQLAFTC